MAMAAEAVGRCLLTVLPIVGVAAADSGDAQWRQQDGAASGAYHRRRRRHLHLPVLLRTGKSRAGARPSGLALSGIEPASASRLTWRITLFALGSAVAGAAIVLQSRLLSPPELQAVTGFAALFLATATFLPLLPAKLWRAVPVGAGAIDRKCHQRCFGGAVACVAHGASAAPGAICASWPVRHRFWRLALRWPAIEISRSMSLKLSLAAVAVAGMLFLVRGVARELLNMAMECEQGPVAEVRRLLVRSQKGVEAASWIGRVLIDTVLIAAWRRRAAAAERHRLVGTPGDVPGLHAWSDDRRRPAGARRYDRGIPAVLAGGHGDPLCSAGARRQGASAAPDRPWRPELDPHRRRLFRLHHGDAGRHRRARPRPVEPGVGRRRAFRRYRFRFAERRQQLRRRADPAGGAADQGRRLGHRRATGKGW